MYTENNKNQLQAFGMIIRDKEFFKKAEKTIKEFMKDVPKEKKAEIKDFDGDSNAEG